MQPNWFTYVGFQAKMAKKNSSSDEPPLNSQSMTYLGLGTETIDVNTLFPEKLTESGSFDLRGFRLSSLGRLLGALPIPALLVDSQFSIIFANESSRKLGDDVGKIQSIPFCSLFPRTRDAAYFADLIKDVFFTRKLRVGEGLVEVGSNRVWGRMNFRCLRLGESRFVLVLIEDLTLEKKQFLLIETNKENMRQAKEKYEKQLHQQTAELKSINERLREEIEERAKTQLALEKSRDSFNSIVEKTSDGIAVLDCQGAILYANRTTARFLERTPESLRGERLSLSLVPGQISEIDIVRHNGDPGTAEMQVSRTQWNGKPSYLVILRDVTDRKRTQQELLRVQKLESLELIAGGLAHDFNNLLTANIANISLAKIRTNRESPIYDALTKAEKASSKARELTRQLLTFTKGRPPVKKPTSLAPLLKDTAALALSGSKVKCKLGLGKDLWPTEIEPSQISMVFQNLLINAQQAMPDGGTILVKAENVVVGAEPRTDEPQSGDGKYVRVIIRDTGSGIPQENLSRIFDPYFTTKPTGSGLGLATSYSVIKKHGGRMEVESRIGVGTSFYVYLPASDQRVDMSQVSDKAPAYGRGKILLMDDEPDIREAASDLLSLLGYHVEAAENGDAAIEKYWAAMKSDSPFNAVIMDLSVAGGMGGAEATQTLLKLDPNARIILSSGHIDEPIMTDFKQYGYVGAIAKPYNAVELGEALRKALMLRNSSHD